MNLVKLKTIFTIPIGILYVVFFSKLADTILGEDEINKMCGGDRHGFLYPAYPVKYAGTNPDINSGTEEQNSSILNQRMQCHTEQRMRRNEFRNRKFTILMIIGLIGLILGSVLIKSSKNPNFDIIGYGLSLGGAMTLIYSTTSNWHNLDNIKKLVISGFIFLSLMGSSYVIFKN